MARPDKSTDKPDAEKAVETTGGRGTEELTAAAAVMDLS